MSRLNKTVLDQYHIDEQIRQGFAGEYYVAYDSRATYQNEVALFIVAEELSSRPGFQEKFLHRMKESQKLKYPSIPTIINFGFHPDQHNRDVYYVAMEKLSGVTLQNLLESLEQKNQLLHLSDTVDIVHKICQATEYIRLNQGLPRNLSPENILLVPTTNYYEQGFQIFLTDLGLSNLFEEDLRPYGRTEIYALGALLYRLSLGEDTFAEQQRAESFRPPRMLDLAIPPAFERVIMTSLISNPNERYDTPGLMAADLAYIRHIVARVHPESILNHKLVDLDSCLASSEATSIDSFSYTVSNNPHLPVLANSTPNKPFASDPKVVSIIQIRNEVKVAPGNNSEPIIVQITNNTTRDLAVYIVVESVRIRRRFEPETLSFGQDWYSITPNFVRIGPKDGGQATAQFVLTFHPPGNPLAEAGTYDLIVTARYRDNEWRDADSQPLFLSVTQIQSCTIDIWPRILAPGELGRVAVTNRGNVTETVDLSWLAKDPNLNFSVQQAGFDRYSLLVGPGDSGSVEFVAWPKTIHWFGKDRTYIFNVHAITQDRRELASPECKVQSQRLIPPWLLVLSALVVAVGMGLWIWNLRPVLADARNCPPKSVLDKNAVISICVNFSEQRVDEIEVLPGNHFINITEKAEVFPASDAHDYQIKLVPRNWLSRILPFLSRPRIMTASVLTPETPQPRLVRFCVTDASKLDSISVCSNDPTKTEALTITQGLVPTLVFTWETEFLDGYTAELTPKTVPFQLDANKALVAAPTEATTYGLTFVNSMGQRLPLLSLQVQVTKILAIVTEPQLYLRKSPGKVYEQIGVLSQGEVLTLLTQPVDYQQNEDPLRWVEVMVNRSGERGWVASEGLGLVNNTNAASGSFSASNGSVVDNITGNSTDTHSDTSTILPLAAALDASGQTNGNTAGIDLPSSMPTFGPTVTPTSTETPLPTATSSPTPSPTVTPEPLLIQTRVEKSEIVSGTCFFVYWNITGVSQVYFNYGKSKEADLTPIYDNRERSAQLCPENYFINPNDAESRFLYVRLYWYIVLLDGTVRHEIYRVNVIDK